MIYHDSGRFDKGFCNLGRPKEPLIEVGLVIEAALSLIDERGLEGLSMRDLGKRLGVNPASFYHHFKNKEDILEAVRGHVVGRVKLPPGMHRKTWEEQIIILAKAYRTALNHHPNAAWLIAASDPTRIRRSTHHHRESLVAALLAAGYNDSQAIMILIGVETLVAGNVLEEITMGPTVEFGDVDAELFPQLYRVSCRKPLALQKALSDLLAVFIAGVKTLLPNQASVASAKTPATEAKDTPRPARRASRGG